MRASGLVIWMMLGAGLVLMYAAIKGASIADVLAGKAGTSAKSYTVSPVVGPVAVPKVLKRIPGEAVILGGTDPSVTAGLLGKPLP